ncbi:hypothetical protein Scep_009248 [Stephania cephalantha]|uniref:Uncharacterized protein n=1 Tax=Stephania cephalantha TaxID=152367 RepID=A0AAP0PCZ1_9MAGN
MDDSSNKEMKLRVLEISQISPPPTSPITESSLPLTYFDLPLLLRAPPELLMFFTIPNININHFMGSLLPQIKLSLSLTLQFFHPLAGNLIWSHQSNQPIIRYSHGDSVSLTVAETNADFNHLSGHLARDPEQVQKLVPQLDNSSSKSPGSVPVFAAQITLFPGLGISLGTTHLHCVSDGRTSAMFLKSWALISRFGDISLVLQSKWLLPMFDRSVIKDVDNKFHRLYLKELVKFIRSKSLSEQDCNSWLLLSLNLKSPPDQVMVTFELTRTDLDSLKRLVSSKSGQSPSRFELACAYIWVCLAKSKTSVGGVGDVGGDEISSISFAADYRARLAPPVPSTYFGNCVIGVRASAKRSDVVGENGIVVALEGIMKEVRELGASVVRNSEARIARLITNGPHRFDVIAGSPQFRFYDVDFGWGRPKKVEFVTVARTGAILFADSRNGGGDGGIEISLARGKEEMDAFGAAFVGGLNDLRNGFRSSL